MGVFVEAYREGRLGSYTVDDMCRKCVELGIETNYIYSTSDKKQFFINLPFKAKQAMENDADYDFSAVKAYPGENELACGLSFDGDEKKWYINGNTSALIALSFCIDVSKYSAGTKDRVKILDVWNTSVCPIDRDDKIVIDILFNQVGLDYPFQAGITKVKEADGSIKDVVLPETVEDFLEYLDDQRREQNADEIEVSTVKHQKSTKKDKDKASVIYEVNFPGMDVDFTTDNFDVVMSAIKKQAYLCKTDSSYIIHEDSPVKFKEGKHPSDLDFAKVKDISKLVDGVEITVHEVVNKKTAEAQGLLITDEELAYLENHEEELAAEEEIGLD
jgi:hypothetical protein